MSPTVALTLFSVSVTLLLAKVAESAAVSCPGGQEKPTGGDTEEVSTTTLPETLPFLSDVRVAVASNGSLTVVLLVALGCFEPPFTHPNVAMTSLCRSYVFPALLPSPTSVQENRRRGSAGAASPEVSLTEPAVKVTVITEKPLKCEKFASAAPLSPRPPPPPAATIAADHRMA